MKKTSKVCSPYLTIYRPQLGSILSILERITGVYLILLGVFFMLLEYLEDSCLLYYCYYKLYFIIVQGGYDSVVIESIILFTILNVGYQIYFISLVVKRYRVLEGEIMNYHLLSHEKGVIYIIWNVLYFIIFSIIVYVEMD